MNRKYLYYILSFTLLGFLLILSYFIGNIPVKEKVNDVRTEQPNFINYVSGVGIVEPESGNVNISSNLNRIVQQVNVSVSDHVKKGEVLFQLENQDLIANLGIKQKEYEKTLANLHKLEALPQKEDLAIAKEAINKALAAFNAAKAQYDRVLNLPNPHAISKEEQDARLYKYHQAEAELEEAQAQFKKVKAGAWQPDLNIAKHEVEEAKAGVEAIQSEILRTTIKSPLDGTVLQIKIHGGETLDPGRPAMVLGNIDELNLRVSIDQYNVTMFNPNSQAVAFRQGDHSTEFPLKFIRIEPSMVPKKYLTNDVQEKVDTQVFEILYRIAKDNSHLYIGEQMDVYIRSEKK